MMNADTLVLLGTQFPTAPSTRPMLKSFRLISTQQHRRSQQGGYGAGRRYQINPRALLPLVEEKTDRKFLDKARKITATPAKGWTI